jgi:hypothetical protein
MASSSVLAASQAGVREQSKSPTPVSNEQYRWEYPGTRDCPGCGSANQLKSIRCARCKERLRPIGVAVIAVLYLLAVLGGITVGIGLLVFLGPTQMPAIGIAIALALGTIACWIVVAFDRGLKWASVCLQVWSGLSCFGWAATALEAWNVSDPAALFATTCSVLHGATFAYLSCSRRSRQYFQGKVLVRVPASSTAIRSNPPQNDQKEVVQDLPSAVLDGSQARSTNASNSLFCRCNHCPGVIEFPPESIGTDVECAHCGLVTRLYRSRETDLAPASRGVGPRVRFGKRIAFAGIATVALAIVLFIWQIKQNRKHWPLRIAVGEWVDVNAGSDGFFFHIQRSGRGDQSWIDSIHFRGSNTPSYAICPAGLSMLKVRSTKPEESILGSPRFVWEDQPFLICSNRHILGAYTNTAEYHNHGVPHLPPNRPLLSVGYPWSLASNSFDVLVTWAGSEPAGVPSAALPGREGMKRTFLTLSVTNTSAGKRTFDSAAFYLESESGERFRPAFMYEREDGRGPMARGIYTSSRIALHGGNGEFPMAFFLPQHVSTDHLRFGYDDQDLPPLHATPKPAADGIPLIARSAGILGPARAMIDDVSKRTPEKLSHLVRRPSNRELVFVTLRLDALKEERFASKCLRLIAPGGNSYGPPRIYGLAEDNPTIGTFAAESGTVSLARNQAPGSMKFRVYFDIDTGIAIGTLRLVYRK